MSTSNNPLSLRNLFAGILVTVVGGLILAIIVQDVRLAPNAEPPATPAVVIPAGYRLYDDFAETRSWQDAWWMDDAGQMCALTAGQSRLSFRCENSSPTDDAIATVHARTGFEQTTGVAAVVNVEKSGGALELVMNLTCAADNSRRAYHIAVDTHEARATEYFPQPGPEWPMTVLGRMDIAPGVDHLLQMERAGSTLEFWVDGQKLTLQSKPELPACFSLTDWVIDLYVWKDGNQLAGAIDRVSTR